MSHVNLLKVQDLEHKENQESSLYFVKLDLSQTFLCALFVDAWPSRDMDGYLQHLLSAVVLWGGASSTRGSVWLSEKCSREIQKYSWEIQGGSHRQEAGYGSVRKTIKLPISPHRTRPSYVPTKTTALVYSSKIPTHLYIYSIHKHFVHVNLG